VDRDRIKTAAGVAWARDAEGRPVLLFPNEWHIDYFARTNDFVSLSEYPIDPVEEAISA